MKSQIGSNKTNQMTGDKETRPHYSVIDKEGKETVWVWDQTDTFRGFVEKKD
jgi:hypothetical protein